MNAVQEPKQNIGLLGGIGILAGQFRAQSVIAVNRESRDTAAIGIGVRTTFIDQQSVLLPVANLCFSLQNRVGFLFPGDPIVHVLLRIRSVRTARQKEIELSMLVEKIERVVSMMPPVRQHIYRLKHMDNLSQKEIAQQLGISENTVESHLKLSMKFLRDKLKDDHNDMLVNCIAIALIYYLQ